ncbi:MAG: DNA-binding protein [Firmicutes bacterium HGW-Firmicutes-16]|nr:MAG: DNA-binding protein [Firmicutes bacterium HGW-Firmicutes-16]
MTQLPELITVKELQSYLGIGRDKAYALVKSKSFPAVKIGGRYYVMKSGFVSWLERKIGKIY